MTKDTTHSEGSMLNLHS